MSSRERWQLRVLLASLRCPNRPRCHTGAQGTTGTDTGSPDWLRFSTKRLWNFPARTASPFVNLALASKYSVLTSTNNAGVQCYFNYVL